MPSAVGNLPTDPQVFQRNSLDFPLSIHRPRSLSYLRRRVGEPTGGRRVNPFSFVLGHERTSECVGDLSFGHWAELGHTHPEGTRLAAPIVPGTPSWVPQTEVG
jgi:hypothetical protein